MPPLILASTSLYRRALLQRLKLPFDCAAPGVDETSLAAQSHLDRAVRLALAKAAAVAARHPGTTVIGSDQIGVCKGALLDKLEAGFSGVELRPGVEADEEGDQRRPQRRPIDVAARALKQRYR